MTPAVVCSVLESDAGATAARVAAAPAGCALVEIRADHLRAGEIEGLVRRASRPVIVTARARRDGGSFDGSEAERREVLDRALQAGAAWVDVEWDGPLAQLASGASADRVILSHHGSPCDAGRLLALLEAMRSCRAGRIKIVPRATVPSDGQAVRDFLACVPAGGAPVACFALGAAGSATRVLAPAWGSWATYGSAGRGRETAEGQLLAAELLEVYDVLRIGPGTRRFALAGTPLGASPSPALHAAGYRAAGLDACYFLLDTPSIDEALAALAPGAAVGVEALGVTIPLKEAAAGRVELADPCAAAAGAVNTVLALGSRWAGHNTDGPAAVSCVRRRLEPRGTRVVVVGAGGTARAIGWALCTSGAGVTFFNRDEARARRVAAELGCASGAWSELAAAEWDVLIQATPLGRGGEEVPLGARLAGRFVLDAVYASRPTPLVERARASGLPVADGYELLLEQALLQFQLMTGLTPERVTFERALDRHLERGSIAAADAGEP